MKPRSPASFSVSEFFDEAGDADRRMRRLERLDMRLERPEHRLRPRDVPELALVVERLVLRPQAQDDVERLPRHVAVDAGHAVDVEHRPVARQAARGDAEIEPALRQMVEHGDAVGELGGVVVRQQEAAGAEAQPLRLHATPARSGGRAPGCGSQGAVWCSPIQASLKPSSSSQRSVCRSHRGRRTGRARADGRAS